MVHVEESVNIRAEPDAVFSLVTDVARKAKLDPSVSVVSVVQKTDGPVGIGTVFHYRLIIEGKIADYQSRCVAFEPGRMMETFSDSTPPFKIRVTVDPIQDGARLTQRESLTLPILQVPVPKAKGLLGGILRLVFGKSEVIKQSQESLADDEAQMEAKFKPRLTVWLNAIKRNLEAEQDLVA